MHVSKVICEASRVIHLLAINHNITYQFSFAERHLVTQKSLQRKFHSISTGRFTSYFYIFVMFLFNFCCLRLQFQRQSRQSFLLPTALSQCFCFYCIFFPSKWFSFINVPWSWYMVEKIKRKEVVTLILLTRKTDLPAKSPLDYYTRVHVRIESLVLKAMLKLIYELFWVRISVVNWKLFSSLRFSVF